MIGGRRGRASVAGTFALGVMLASPAGCYRGSACAVSARDLAAGGGGSGWSLVSGVRLVRQTADDDCGAAALAMMLGHWSVVASRADIIAAIAREPGRGIALGALRDFARGRGLAAYVIEGKLTDLETEVGLDRPILVGLVQRYSDHPRSHFEVVAGLNRSAHKVLLLDPARGLREDTIEGFQSEWTAAGRPTLVIVAVAA